MKPHTGNRRNVSQLSAAVDEQLRPLTNQQPQTNKKEGIDKGYSLPRGHWLGEAVEDQQGNFP